MTGEEDPRRADRPARSAGGGDSVPRRLPFLRFSSPRI